MKAIGRVAVLFHSFLTLALDDGELSHSCCGHFTPREVTPSTYCKRGFVGPSVVSVLQRRGKSLVHVKIIDGSLIKKHSSHMVISYLFHGAESFFRS